MKITTGTLTEPAKLVIYGTEGIGKTTLASQAPRPLIIDMEGGSGHIDSARVRAESWDDVLDVLAHAEGGKLDYATLIFDTWDWMERLLSAWMCKRDKQAGIESYGFGKGYKVLEEEQNKLLRRLDKIRGLGYNVVVLAHAKVVKFEEPGGDHPYDRYELKCEKRGAGLIKEWGDAVLFANFYTETVKEDNKVKAVGGTERVLYTQRTAAYDAKNRQGLAPALAVEYASIAPLFVDRQAAVEEQEDSAVLAQVLDLVEDLDQDRVVSYLVSKKMLAAGQTLSDLTEPHRVTILKHSARFLAAAEAHA